MTVPEGSDAAPEGSDDRVLLYSVASAMPRPHPAAILIACAAFLGSGGTALSAGLVRTDLRLVPSAHYVSLAHPRGGSRQARAASLTPMPPVPLPRRVAPHPPRSHTPSPATPPATGPGSEPPSAPSSPSSASIGRLPRTGTNVALETLIATGLLAVGATLRMRAVRRRSRHPAGSAYRR